MPIVIKNTSDTQGIPPDNLTFTCPYTVGQQVWVIHQNRIKPDTVLGVDIRGSVRGGQPPAIRFDVELLEQGYHFNAIYLTEQHAIDGVLGKFD